ncbi:protein FAM217A isoform X3 [Ochotona princeps]|uniref:protein FAM217A isoform X3 n=1 Tax=Ochotona princeps TaxID=9978 RepID=UPI0027144F27|nr:protein FAM217A isoform X3 [Ochotona princeps]
MSGIPQENFSLWNLDSEIPVPENKNFQPRGDGAAGGRISKNHLEFPVEQLMLELNLSEHAQKRTQNCKQGVFRLWSYPLHEGSTMENREFRASAVEAGSRGSSNPISLFPLNHSLPSASAEKHLESVPGPPMPWDLCWPYADGDFLKDTDELHSSSRSAVECKSARTFPAPPWTLRCGNSSVEENLTDESDVSETEKTNDTLLSYFKKMDSKLKPETIENIEDSFPEEPDEAFAYPDFLPAPFHALDLHKLALSKSESWRAAADPVESAIEPLITRLLELERLQHATIQKEKLRLQPAVCAPTAPEQPSAAKATPRAKQPKAADPLSSQTSWAEKSREKRKNNSGSYKLEQNASKWNWSSSGKCKWDSRPTSLKSSSTVRQLTACDDPKNLRGSLLNPGQELAAKPTLAQTTHSLVTMVSTRSPPPRSPMPVSPVPLTFPENPREEIEAPRTKKNLHRKNIALNRPYYIQKLNCLSTSFIAQNKCSPIDQK